MYTHIYTREHTQQTDLLLKCSSLDTAERYYMHSLKQALFLLHGSTRAYNSMSVEDQKQLWESVWQGGSRQSFAEVAAKLKPVQAESRALPIRIFVITTTPSRGSQKGEDGGESVDKTKSNSSSSSSSNSNTNTNPLPPRGMHKLSKSFPQALQRPVSAASSSSLSLSQVLHEAKLCTNLDLHTLLMKDAVRVVVAGVQIPLNAPIYELWSMFAHADLFLYMVVVLESL